MIYQFLKKYSANPLTWSMDMGQVAGRRPAGLAKGPSLSNTALRASPVAWAGKKASKMATTRGLF